MLKFEIRTEFYERCGVFNGQFSGTKTINDEDFSDLDYMENLIKEVQKVVKKTGATVTFGASDWSDEKSYIRINHEAGEYEKIIFTYKYSRDIEKIEPTAKNIRTALTEAMKMYKSEQAQAAV